MQFSIIEVINIKKNFNQNQSDINVLNGINFSFLQNQSYTITGVSGTGKSTFLSILAGIDKPTEGKILFNNYDINQFNNEEKENFLNKKIGIIFQEPYLINELSVLENVMLKSLIKKNNKNNIKEDRNYAMDLLKKIDLAHKANYSPATLSGGQQQRIAILRAIFNKPEFLLADEPTGNLDEKTSSEIIEFLIKCKNNFSIGLIISTHDKNLAQATENILQLKDGLFEKFN